MRLARRALVAALAMLMLCSAALTQTLRSENDPRNQAPTVGTGGPVGGPTGLFTVYDAQTLRRGEFTIDLSYSNYDRDPGNVDIVVIPSSVQVGISDYLELFFNADHYKGIKVNNPQNLSSFYVPNAQVLRNPLRSGAAIVLAPVGVAGLSGAVFRPAGTQPFVQFPFTGTLGNLGGDPRFAPQIGGGITGGGDGFFQNNFGAAGNFPGIGSVFGSILPGIVLSTTAGPAPFGQVPDAFTVAPTYLPDAPFINRIYGESSYSTFVIGGKIRLSGPNNAAGVALIPFYRFYWDRGDEQRGFNQLQRGASPGGDIGDFGLILAADARLSRSVNISGNLGYIANSNPQSNAFGAGGAGGGGGGDINLLDRPSEIISGIGFDFPVNQFFQPILELRSIIYVDRTPNEFENNPIDFLGGVRVFPSRWWGFTAAYRRHLNQQDEDFSRARGFIPSDDPNGFIVQLFAGRRNERAPEVLPNQPPTVTLTASPTVVTICPEDPARANPPNGQVALSAQATDPDGDTLLYTYSTTGGRVVGEGPNVTWDLSGVQPGTYTATVEVDDGCGCVAFSSTTVTVERCPVIETRRPCPTVSVDCPSTVEQNNPITFTARVEGGDPNVTPTYTWTVSAGTITSGQGTPSITVDTAGLGGQSVTATVTVGGLPAECQATASCTTNITAPPRVEQPPARKIDEYGRLRPDDEKARLDNFAIALQGEPGAQGVIITYGGRRGPAGEAQRRATFARDYLVNQRGIDPGRIQTIDGGFREEASTELWIVPAGAAQPTASPTLDASQVQTTPERRAPRRRSTRRRR